MRQHPLVESVLAEMRIVDLPNDHEDVARLVDALRARLGVGPRVASLDRALRWRGVLYRGAVVAVAGERWCDLRLEVCDCASDSSRAGKLGVLVLAHAYKALFDSGAIDELRYAVLYENVAMWKAAMLAMNAPPWGLLFIHRREVA